MSKIEQNYKILLIVLVWGFFLIGINCDLTDSQKQQVFRIVKGELGPSHLTQSEAIRMIQTIQNRVNHRDIPSNLNDPNHYHTLRYPQQNYKLNPTQQSTLQSAWANRNNVPNSGHLGWDTSRTSIPSNKYYQWTADQNRYGQHYYYRAKQL